MNSSRYKRYIGEHAFDNDYLSEAEIKSVLSEFNTLNPKPGVLAGLPLLSDGKTMYLDNADYHTLILGATGSMKTRLFVMPGVHALGQAGENMVITDPKGEIYERTSGFLKSQGYDIKVLNFRDTDHTDYWNPLYEAAKYYREGNSQDKDFAIGMVSDLVQILAAPFKGPKGDPYWMEMATNYTMACILMEFVLCKDINKISLRSVDSFINAAAEDESYDDDDEIDIKRLFSIIPPTHVISSKGRATVNTARVTKQGIVVTAKSLTNMFTNSIGISRMTTLNTINIHDFSSKDKKTALFVIVPDEKTSTHSLAALFVKQVYETLVRDAQKLEGFRLPRRLNFILDEFANMPEIADMGSMISAARSRNIRFNIVIQNNSQLVSNYGLEKAETIKSNCLNWVYLSTKENALLEQLQKMGGNKVTSRGEKPVLNMEDLNGLKKGWGYAEALLLLARAKPHVTKITDIDSYPAYKKLDAVPFPKLKKKFDFYTYSDILKEHSMRELKYLFERDVALTLADPDDESEKAGNKTEEVTGAPNDRPGANIDVNKDTASSPLKPPFGDNKDDDDDDGGFDW
ncbi:MAG: type IV secretory system conjugative DNA transfer family protein [Bacilli bacterium]|nr:type IV secretory system conjugative DNA transfer family protein [Bacilli bacterium]